jgi:ubiquinone/menaquinone biosynthesis C-methylase UbiE
MAIKYDKIGVGYNTTRKADPYLLGRMFDLLQSQPGQPYLDVGCGTGNYTIALHEMGLDIIGLDPSLEMLDKAQSRAPEITWRKGVAEELHFADGSFQGILASLTLHHWRDIRVGLSEAARVLKPGGRMVMFTATPQQMEGYWLRHYFPKMLADSTRLMPTLEDIAEAMALGGLQLITTEKYFIQEDLQDWFLLAGKHNPSIYLQPEVRRGISSFAAVANAEEVERGLIHLAADIESGKVKDVIERYSNQDGDYLFVVGEK